MFETMFSLFLRMLSCCQGTHHHSATWRRLCSHWRSWKKSRVSFTAKTHCSQGAPSVILYLSFWRWMLKLIKIDLLSTLPPTVREMKSEYHRHTVGSFEQESLQMWCIFSYRPCFFLDFIILNWASRVATATGEMPSSVGVCGSGGAWRKCV